MQSDDDWCLMYSHPETWIDGENVKRRHPEASTIGGLLLGGSLVRVKGNGVSLHQQR